MISIMFACAPHRGTYIKINNNSNHTILIEYSESYPDTSLNNLYSICKIQPFSNCENYMEFSHVDTLIFIIHDIDTIEKYGIDTYDQEYKILKRYDLSMKELEDMNWIVNFP